MIRAMNPVTGVTPFASVNCADMGDVPPNPVDIQDSLNRVADFVSAMTVQNIVPMTAGGDHLVTLPILRALAKTAPVGLIQFDSHTDLFDSYFGGQKFTHGTPFRRAIEEGLLDPTRVVQIGIRGTMYDGEDIEWGRQNGVHIITIDEVYETGLDAIMHKAREIVGDSPTYVSFDIDAIDPSYAPGTGTPEIGGFTSYEAQRIVRKLAGLNLIGADLVEVSPPFDPTGGTGWVGVSIMFELLCVLATATAKTA
jgi:guanidinopropionase